MNRDLNNIRLLLTVILSVGVTLSCNTNLAGTESSSETTNGFTASVVYSDGTAAQGAVVRLIDAQAWMQKTMQGGSAVVDSAFAGQDGLFIIDSVDTNGRFFLQIDSDREGYLFREEEVGSLYSKQTETLRLKPYASLCGYISAENGSVTRVRIAGTTYETTPSAEGAFEFAKVCSGSFPIAADVVNGPDTSTVLHSAVELLPSQSSNDTFIVAAGKYLVEDFRNGFDRPSFSTLTGAYWFVYPEAPRDTLASISYGAVTNGAYLNRSFSSTIILRDLSNSMKGVGCQLVDLENGIFDFTRLESVSFMARGQGNIRISLESEYFDTSSVYPKNDEQFGYLFSLSPDWEEIRVPVDSLTLPPYTQAFKQGVTWSQVSAGLIRMEFEAAAKYNSPGDTVQFDLDEIYLQGKEGIINR